VDSSRIASTNEKLTNLWHINRMPDDDHYFAAPRPDPERIDLAAIKTDLEFAIDEIARLRTHIAQTALGWWFLAR